MCSRIAETESAKVSVIIPVYNAENYLVKCFDSVLNQTFQDFELILINDGSTDGSGAICDQYGLKDARIKVVHCQNGGVSAARNKGLDLARGEYVFFMDSDDYIEYTLLEKTLEHIRKEQADILVFGFDTEFEDNRILGCVPTKEGAYCLSNIEERKNFFYYILNEGSNIPSVCCKLFSREMIEKFGIRFKNGIVYGEDENFSICCYAVASKIKLVREIYYHYIKREGQATKSFSVRDRLFNKNEHMKAMLNFLKERHCDEVEHIFPAIYFILMYTAIEAGLINSIIKTRRIISLKKFRDMVHEAVGDNAFMAEQFSAIVSNKHLLGNELFDDKLDEKLEIVRYIVDGDIKKVSFKARTKFVLRIDLIISALKKRGVAGTIRRVFSLASKGH